MYFPEETGKHPYTLYAIWNGQVPTMKLAIGFTEGVKLVDFQLPNAAFSSPVKTYKQASALSQTLKGVSNKENTSRLFGKALMGSANKGWLNVDGIAENGEIYIPFDKGTIELGIQNNNYSELFFSGSKLSGRWFLRKLPNIFDKSLLGDRESEICVLWKPSKQSNSPSEATHEVTCACPMKTLNSNPVKPDKVDKYVMKSSMTMPVITGEGTFEGIATAEGTWIDMFGVKYVYTADFVKLLASRMQEAVKTQSLLVDKHHQNDDNGTISSVLLVQDPINHVKVQGKYNGDLSDVLGMSMELRLRSVWSDEFQAWVPFDAMTDRVSLVSDPACKICWFTTQVNNT